MQFYSDEMKEKILNMYVEGMSLVKIAAEDGMPSYGTILRWVKDKDDFRKEFESARLARALHFEEKAIEAAEDTTHKDDVPAQRLKFDAYKWGAEVNDASRYGKKTVVEGNASKPIVFQINTGIPQGQIPDVELDEQGLIKQVKQDIVEAEVVTSEQEENNHNG
jgi:transposase-like protein